MAIPALKIERIDLRTNGAKVLLLSAQDRNLILAALENPPEPNEALKRLFR